MDNPSVELADLPVPVRAWTSRTMVPCWCPTEPRLANELQVQKPVDARFSSKNGELLLLVLLSLNREVTLVITTHSLLPTNFSRERACRQSGSRTNLCLAVLVC